MFPGSPVNYESISFRNFRFTRIKVDFAYIPAGTFFIGSKESSYEFEKESPQHKVTITKPFLMQQTEVNQNLWFAVMGTDPSNYKHSYGPVENVSWYDAVEFCNALSSIASLPPAYTINGTDVEFDPQSTGYRLPTESEWEYACTIGGTAPRHVDEREVSWHGESTSQSDIPRNRNQWNLYNMIGNVSEWTNDWYSKYDEVSKQDPTGPEEGKQKVVRGGRHWYLRATYRQDFSPKYKSFDIGFRVCRTF
jgi:sulfatase modifying factor 1